eukprot:TRINITY_DN16384_c0_g1_i1.p1 TRINITY_DN16384_c0_g1~~TRINITY_DN16384_c0_g1_i1.p1  ORF type:complete len:173 (-),score=29.85 TRINITY_DN16384_c0_g1_i1:4-498(-)
MGVTAKLQELTKKQFQWLITDIKNSFLAHHTACPLIHLSLSRLLKWIAGNNGFARSTKENSVFLNDPLDKEPHPSIIFIKQDLLDPPPDIKSSKMTMDNCVYIGNLSVSKDLGSFDELRKVIMKSFGSVIDKSHFENYEDNEMQYDSVEQPNKEVVVGRQGTQG